MNNMPWHVDRRETTNPQTALSESPRGASQNQSYIPPEMRSLEALKHKNWIRGPSLGETSCNGRWPSWGHVLGHCLVRVVGKGCGAHLERKIIRKTHMFVMFVSGLNVAGWDNVDHQGYVVHGMMRLEGLRQDGSQSANSRADT